MMRLTLTGLIGADAEVRHIDGGRAAISFSLAHTEKWKNAQGQPQERTTWTRCTIWRKQDQTGVAQYLLKGTRLLVEGMPSARAWTDKEGKPQASLELTVSELEFLGGAKQQQSTPSGNAAQSNVEHWKQQEAAAAKTQQSAAPIVTNPFTNDDDLPF